MEDKRRHADEIDRLLDDHAFTLTADPTRVVQPPPREGAVPQVDFTALESAVARLKHSAQAYDAAYTKLSAGDIHLRPAQRTRLNELLQGMEQKLTDARGLPGRDWFRHFIYAPGALTGYAVKTVPAVREAIEAGRWDEANEYARVTAGVINAYTDRLDQATALLTGT